jgi:hypothetical protein
VLGDTWAWDGQSWTQLQPPASPPARAHHSMATDPVRGRILLFGGGFVSAGQFTAAFNDTWEWDGSTWRQIFPANVPAVRGDASVVWHSGTSALYMWAGWTGWFVSYGNEVWRWTGADWIRQPDTPLSGIGDMVKEPNAQTFIGRGTTDGRTIDWWRWDGSTWSKTAIPATFPGGRYSLDEARQRIVHMGSNPPLGPTCGWPTWEWDGQRWYVASEWGARTFVRSWVWQGDKDRVLAVVNNCGTQRGWMMFALVDDQLVQISSGTPALTFANLVTYVEHLGQVLAFGGQGTTTRETWTWDEASGWTEWKGPQPDQTYGTGVYDSVRRKVVFLTSTRRTWEWDERSGWVEVLTKSTPPKPIELRQFAYDPVRRRCVIYGSTSTTGTWLWEYDGTDWQERKPQKWPTPRAYAAMAYAGFLGGVVLAGGLGATPTGCLQDAWLWDGNDWRQIVASNGTNDLCGQEHAVYDPGRRRLLLFDMPNAAQRVTRWELSAEALQLTTHHPLAGQPFAADVELRAEAGRPFLLAFAGSHWPAIPLRAVPGIGLERLPLAADPLFLLSLQVGLVAALDGSGRARFPLVVPADPQLVGLRLHFAGASFGPSGVAAITNRAWIDVR